MLSSASLLKAMAASETFRNNDARLCLKATHDLRAVATHELEMPPLAPAHNRDGCGFLTFKAVGSTGKVSDGEEGYLPVLSRRIFVTESLPLPIRGPATKKFEFAKLIKSGKSDTLRHQSLLVQMVSNSPCRFPTTSLAQKCP